MRSIFRYPGGKKKIASRIIDEVIEIKPSIFVDVFVGGGSVFIELLNRKINLDTVVNDLDIYISTFWKLLSNGDYQKIIDLIKEWDRPTIEKFNKLRSTDNSSDSLIAFKAIFFNRTTFSGIFSSGPIGGYGQEGKYKLDARYNMEKMISEIKEIGQYLPLINTKCFSKDFREIINLYKDNPDALLYLDPPYFKQGHQLYRHSMNKNDYEDMANILRDSKCSWIVSHDNNIEFTSLFKGWSNITNIDNVAYTINSIKGNRKSEILISNRDFIHLKRKRGRPKTTENFYALKCSRCDTIIKINPVQIISFSERNKIIPEKIKNSYLCRRCKKLEKQV